jgi:hypothetical protein
MDVEGLVWMCIPVISFEERPRGRRGDQCEYDKRPGADCLHLGIVFGILLEDGWGWEQFRGRLGAILGFLTE